MTALFLALACSSGHPEQHATFGPHALVVHYQESVWTSARFEPLTNFKLEEFVADYYHPAVPGRGSPGSFQGGVPIEKTGAKIRLGQWTIVDWANVHGAKYGPLYKVTVPLRVLAKRGWRAFLTDFRAKLVDQIEIETSRDERGRQEENERLGTLRRRVKDLDDSPRDDYYRDTNTRLFEAQKDLEDAQTRVAKWTPSTEVHELTKALAEWDTAVAEQASRTTARATADRVPARLPRKTRKEIGDEPMTLEALIQQVNKL